MLEEARRPLAEKLREAWGMGYSRWDSIKGLASSRKRREAGKRKMGGGLDSREAAKAEVGFYCITLRLVENEDGWKRQLEGLEKWLMEENREV